MRFRKAKQKIKEADVIFIVVHNVMRWNCTWWIGWVEGNFVNIKHLKYQFLPCLIGYA